MRSLFQDWRHRLDRPRLIQAARVHQVSDLIATVRILHADLPTANALTQSLLLTARDAGSHARNGDGVPVHRVTKALFPVTPELIAWAVGITAGLLSGFMGVAARVFQLAAERLAEEPELAPSFVGLTSADVNRVLLMADQGVPLDEIERRIEDVIDGRADLIADTETYRASVRGEQEAWAFLQNQRLQPVLQQWVAVDDELTCPICADLDGLTVPLGGRFGPYDGPPDPHPRCRCFLLPVGLDG